MKKIFLLLFASLIFASGVFSQSNFKQQVGISLKASTNGLGGDVYYRPFKMFAIKAGVEIANIDISSQTANSILGNSASISLPMSGSNNLEFDMGAKFKTGSYSITFGFQPFGALYFTAGVGSFLFNTQVIGTPTNDLTFETQTVTGVGTVTPKIAKEKIGTFSISINPTNKIAPYFGIGLGSFVPRKKNVSFALELGAFYMGAPKLQVILPSGLNSDNVDWGATLTPAQKAQYFGTINTQIDNSFNELKTEVNNQVADINTKIAPFAFYPVLKLTIGIKALEF
jgi:hypothetical protein